MNMLLLMLASFVLGALTVVSLVKNFFVNFNVSDNGWKTAMITVLIVICLFCAGMGYSEAYTVRDINSLLLTPISEGEIEALKGEIPLRTSMAIISIIIGYAALLINMKLIKNIKENKKRLVETNKENRWVKKA